MGPELTTVLMLLSLLVLLAGFPLAFGIGTVGVFFGLLTSGSAFLYMIPMRVVTGTLSTYIFAAVPLFLFMGTMMQTSGIAERAFKILHKWMGGINGGLAVALSDGREIAEAIRFANACGALAATRLGAQPSLPTRAEVATFWKREGG